MGSSGSRVSGPGHFMGFCPEKQGLGATPAMLGSKGETAYLRPPGEMPVLPNPTRGTSCPEDGSRTLASLCQDRNS